jgi:hypothetical protein
MVGTQQVQEIMICRYNIKGKDIIRLNAEKTPILDSQVIRIQFY